MQHVSNLLIRRLLARLRHERALRRWGPVGRTRGRAGDPNQSSQNNEAAS
jgi:hypothetical protein